MASKLQFLMYFIISVFSTFLAVACTSDNDVPFPDSEAPSIDFEGSALTRGIVNAADDMSAFDVWGWYSPISGTGTARQVFDATLVSRNGTTWTYDNIQRWQQGNSYQFYAIYPSFDAECGYESAYQLVYYIMNGKPAATKTIVFEPVLVPLADLLDGTYEYDPEA